MNTALSKPNNLWREAVDDFIVFAKNEWQWIVVFAALITLEQRLPFLNVDMNSLRDQLVQAQGDPGKAYEIFVKYFPGIIFSTVANVIIGALSTFLFTILYLRRTVIGGAQLGFNSFVPWLAKIVQKYVLLFLPLAALLALFVVVWAFRPSDAVQQAAEVSFAVAGMVWFFFFYYGLYLFFLVSPIALLKPDEPALKVSAALAKGRLWRLWWGSLIVLVIVYAVFLPLVLVNVGIFNAFGAEAIQTQISGAIVNGAIDAASSAITAVYTCVAYRIITLEQAEKGA